MITSTGNVRLKHLAELQRSARLRNSEGLFVSEGYKLFSEAPENFVQEIYVRTDTRKELEESFLKTPYAFYGTVFEKLRRLADSGVPVEEVSESAFLKITQTKTPQGIAAVLKKPSYTLDELLPPEGAGGGLLVLEDIQDPGNLGTMMRTAEAAGMCGMILSGKTADLFNPKVVRATMGSLYRVPFLYEDDICVIIDRLKKESFCICAAHLDGDADYDKADYGSRTAVLIGNEGNGLSEALTQKADIRVRIPMCGELESLNAAVAAALLMYQIRKGNGKW